MKAISVRQPYAWLIVQGYKPVENRGWSTRYRGTVAIHASAGCSRAEYEQACESVALAHVVLGLHPPSIPPYSELPRGGYVGIAQIIDCVVNHSSPYFFGPFGHVIANARPIEFIAAKGALNYFSPDPTSLSQLHAL